MEDLMTTADAADELRCSVSTVRRLIDEGELQATRVGGRWLIAAADVDELRDELEAEDEEGSEDEDGDEGDGDEDEEGEDEDGPNDGDDEDGREVEARESDAD